MKIYLGLIAAAALSLSACGGGEQAAAPAPASAAPAPASEAPAAPVEAAPASAPAESSAPAATSTTDSSASAPAANEAATAPAASAECSAVITSDDAMKYDPKEITIKSSCKQYTITLKHVGKMPAAAMGHNVVIAKAADVQGVLADGAAATDKQDYVKPDDARVVGHTKLIGGGEESSVTIDTAKLAKGEAYEYFCSFPGHYAMMNGKIILAD